MPLMGFTSPLNGSVAICLNEFRMRFLSSIGRLSVSFIAFLWMRTVNVGLFSEFVKLHELGTACGYIVFESLLQLSNFIVRENFSFAEEKQI